MLLKIIGKVLLDRNTMYNLIVYRIHIYWFLLLFTVYTITVYWYTVLLLSLYRFSILGNMNIICFNWIK